MSTPPLPDPSGFVPPAPVPPGTPPAAVVAPQQRRSTLGLVALIAAIVGFVFACIPGALIVGWILLPIAFILAIVSLFQSGRKSLGVWALILSIVGTIVGVIVSLTLVVGAVDEALEEQTSSTVTTPTDDATDDGAATETEAAESEPAETEAAETAEETAEAPAGDVGTRDNPAPIGSVIAGEEWEVVVNSIDLNGTEATLAANQFNEAPAEGMTYAIVNATITYRGEDSSIDSWVGFAWVTADGQVIESSDSFVVAPDPAIGLNELYTDASFTGNQVLEIPADGAGLLRVRPGLFADELFVAAG